MAKKTETPFVIAVDSREKHGFEFDPQYETHTCCLETGDYAVIYYTDVLRDKYTDDDLGHLLCIERKASVQEVVQNLIEPRFTRELERMAQFKHAYLLCCFSFQDVLKYPVGSNIPKRKWRYLRIKAPFIIASLAAISMKYGVHVMYCGSQDNGAYMATELIKRCTKQYVERK